MSDIKVHIDLLGLPKVKADIKSILDLFKEQARAIENLQKSSAKKLIEIEKDKFEAINRLGDKHFRSEEARANRIAQLHKLAQEKMTQTAERETARRSKIARSSNGGSVNLESLGQFAGAAGMYRTGHLLRAVSGLQISAGSLAALGGVALAATPVILAFAGLAEAAKYTAGAFLGAVTELGKARNLQQMIVEAGENQRAGQLARLTVAPGERMTDDQMTKWAASMAANPAFGGHSSGDWRKAAGVLGTDTGQQRSILGNKGLMNTLGNLAHIGGLTPEQSLGIYSSFYNQNRNLNPNQITSLIRSGVGIGREGQFNVGDLAKGGGKVTSMAGTFFGGDYLSNVKSSLAYAAMVKGKTPGKSLEEAGTEASAFFRELSTPAHRGAANQLGVKFDKDGNILNPNQALAHIVANRGMAKELIPGLGGRESGPFMGHMATGIEGLAPGDEGNNKKVEEALLNQIKRYKELSISQEQLQQESDDNIGAADRLQTAFNRLSDILSPTLLHNLERMADVLNTFVDDVDKNKESLKDF